LKKIEKIWDGYYAEMNNLKKMEKIYGGFQKQMDKLEKMAKLFSKYPEASELEDSGASAEEML